MEENKNEDNNDKAIIIITNNNVNMEKFNHIFFLCIYCRKI